MKNNKLNDTLQIAFSFFERISRYKIVIIILMVALVYGFIFLRISQLSGAQPSQSMIDAKTSTIKTTRVDKNVVQQLQSLQDNSVSVKALFETARNNPFQE
jgi:Tfp pilus assembly protein PilO